MRRLSLIVPMVTLMLVMSACGGSSGLSEAQLAYKDGLDASIQGLISEAISHYDRAIQLDPDTAVYYRNRGVAYNKLGQHQNAITDYTKAIQLDAFIASAYANRGSAYETLGQYSLADADETTACSLDSWYC